MILGVLGKNIVFYVTDKQVRTFNNMNWSGSAKYAVHQRHGGDALTEYVGTDPDTISFDMYFSAHLGEKPMTNIEKLFNEKRNATPMNLLIGGKFYGKYRWTISSIKIKLLDHDFVGDVASATVSVSLQEYLLT